MSGDDVLPQSGVGGPPPGDGPAPGDPAPDGPAPGGPAPGGLASGGPAPGDGPAPGGAAPGSDPARRCHTGSSRSSASVRNSTSSIGSWRRRRTGHKARRIAEKSRRAQLR